MSQIQTIEELIAIANISQTSEHHYSSGHVEYRLDTDAGYIVLQEDEYQSILFKPL